MLSLYFASKAQRKMKGERGLSWLICVSHVAEEFVKSGRITFWLPFFPNRYVLLEVERGLERQYSFEKRGLEGLDPRPIIKEISQMGTNRLYRAQINDPISKTTQCILLLSRAAWIVPFPNTLLSYYFGRYAGSGAIYDLRTLGTTTFSGEMKLVEQSGI